MTNTKGQVVLILILIMTVALGIGISVIQRSLSDIATSTKVEESSRAFSAAEAGLEKAIQQDSSVAQIDLGNNSAIQDVSKNSVPGTNQALEYPPLAKEDMAHVWLADPQTPNLDEFYARDTIDVYWGNVDVIAPSPTPTTTTHRPAIAVTVVYQTSSTASAPNQPNAYQSKKFFYDQEKEIRNNGFELPDNCSPPPITTSLTALISPTDTKNFYCKTAIDVSSTNLCGTLTCLEKLVLIRARLLYNSNNQAFAVRPTGGASLPMQGRVFIATGVSGVTQRKIQVFRVDKVVPAYFDYAIFSAGEVTK